MVEETDTKDLEDTKGEIMEILRRVSDFRIWAQDMQRQARSQQHRGK